MALRTSRSYRRIGAIVATLGAAGALAMALLPSASASTPAPTTGSFNTNEVQLSTTCADLGLGNTLIAATQPNPGSLQKQGYTASNDAGKGVVDQATQKLTVTLNAGATVTAIVAIAYPSQPYVVHNYNKYVASWSGPVTVTDIVAPGKNPSGGSPSWIKRWMVCGSYTKPAPTTAAVATTAPTTAARTTAPATTAARTTAPATTAARTTAPATTRPAATTAPPTTAVFVPAASSAGTGPTTTAPPASVFGTNLPRTGDNLSGFLWGGGALLLAGVAVLLFVGDRRSRRRAKNGTVDTASS